MGDLTTAGSAEFSLVNSLERGFASLAFGEDEYFRTVFGDSVKRQASAHSPSAVRPLTTMARGCWRKTHTVSMECSAGTPAMMTTSSISPCSATRPEWTSSDQIPERAILGGQLDRYGYLDPTNGGQSQRYSLSMNWGRLDNDVRWRGNAYVGYYRPGSLLELHLLPR